MRDAAGRKLRRGDRVRHDYLGEGTVVGPSSVSFLTIVWWDKPPAWQYNMETNPSHEPTAWLVKIE